MAYGQKIWEDDITYLNADNFNNMEEGISTALNKAQENAENIVNINTTITSIDTRLNDLTTHISSKENPHEVNAAQLGVYTKEETYNKTQIENKIAQSGGSSGGSINVDTTLTLEYTSPNYAILIENIADINPQNIYVTITSKDDNIPSGILYIDSIDTPIIEQQIDSNGTFKLCLDYEPGFKNGIHIQYTPDSGLDDAVVTISYLTEGGVEKLLDYIDLATVSNLITSGTDEPSNAITSPYYFRYSE